ncbi:helix-turn-helix transcriptional regulator [Methylorubrum sp. B1-46]|uniref:helix-turn-helix transcriptional regulator n=1 Tax=Methylorubrum sp. B1-46 TaxID=2897334 RepID=UPI001E36665E|nr:helix-turn-helix transcriptional regulator [Methylorubrum sp. B1-46]UGB26386.1 helix-turn-helix transcriptional regulator [Methylorubrum sp. B1-46]
MSPLAFIRREIFGATQAEMAAVAGVSQSTVSKWEAGLLEPGRVEMERIRKGAAGRGLAWCDEWFFQPPASSDCKAPEAMRA